MASESQKQRNERRERYRRDYERLELARTEIAQCQQAAQQITAHMDRRQSDLCRRTAYGQEELDKYKAAIQEYTAAIEPFMAHSEAAMARKSAEIDAMKAVKGFVDPSKVGAVGGEYKELAEMRPEHEAVAKKLVQDIDFGRWT